MAACDGSVGPVRRRQASPISERGYVDFAIDVRRGRGRGRLRTKIVSRPSRAVIKGAFRLAGH